MTTILIADDAAFMRMRCGRMLAEQGFEVLEAENGREAVRQYAAHRPDAVLLDITMPELDGLAALQEIRELDPNARVVMVTALGQQHVVMAALQAGARDFVVKPFQPERVLGAVQRVLAFGRPSQDSAPAPVDLAAVLREVARLTSRRWSDASQAQGRPISLHVEAERGLYVEGWAENLREALTNLVFNAVDALPDGGTIRLSAARRGSDVVVEVADSGVGMPPEVQARLFEPFYSTKGERGTGLGLAVVESIVERHQGPIAVESAPGQGTTFRLTFPASAPASVARPAAPAGPPPSGRPLRVLAVDDVPAMGRTVARVLAFDGHYVVVATSGEEAVERLAAEPFDMVISDVGMGAGINGWELAEHVRTRYPGVRFALATGWGAQIDPQEARTRGWRRCWRSRTARPTCNASSLPSASRPAPPASPAPTRASGLHSRPPSVLDRADQPRARRRASHRRKRSAPRFTPARSLPRRQRRACLAGKIAARLALSQ